MIYIIGIGVEGRDSLTERALKAVRGAGLLAGGKRHLDEFPESGAEKVLIGGKLEEAANAISGHLKKKKGPAVVLATGDPLFFGIGDYIIRKFGREKVEVVPNVSTVQEAFARIRESWNGARILSAHGRNTDLKALCREVKSHDKAAILTDPVNTPAVIARALIDSGADYYAHVCEALGSGKEKITEGSLKSIARRKAFHPLNIMVLVKKGEKKAARERKFGLPDSDFVHAAGMITKEEFRVISLSKLDLKDDSVVWDIGACSGSVSVEAARLAPLGKVFAVEKDGKRLKDMERNRKKFGLLNMEIVKGVAPGCLEGLPVPDAVFVGGGGADMVSILGYAGERLLKGGRLVVNAVTLETAAAASDFFRKKGWEKELVLVNMAKARSIGVLSLLAANNPLFIIKGVKP